MESATFGCSLEMICGSCGSSKLDSFTKTAYEAARFALSLPVVFKELPKK